MMPSLPALPASFVAPAATAKAPASEKPASTEVAAAPANAFELLMTPAPAAKKAESPKQNAADPGGKEKDQPQDGTDENTSPLAALAGALLVAMPIPPPAPAVHLRTGSSAVEVDPAKPESSPGAAKKAAQTAETAAAAGLNILSQKPELPSPLEKTVSAEFAIPNAAKSPAKTTTSAPLATTPTQSLPSAAPAPETTPAPTAAVPNPPMPAGPGIVPTAAVQPPQIPGAPVTTATPPANSAAADSAAAPTLPVVANVAKITAHAADRLPKNAAPGKSVTPAKADGYSISGPQAVAKKGAGTAVAKGTVEMNPLAAKPDFAHPDETTLSPAMVVNSPASATSGQGTGGQSSNSHRESQPEVATLAPAAGPDSTTWVSPAAHAFSSGTMANGPTSDSQLTSPGLPAALRTELHSALERIHSHGDSVVQVKVNLQGAGEVAIQLSLRGGGLQATVQTNSPELREALQQHWSQLQSNSDPASPRLADLKFTATPEGASDFNRQNSSRHQQSQSEARGGFDLPADTIFPTKNPAYTTARRLLPGNLAAWA